MGVGFKRLTSLDLTDTTSFRLSPSSGWCPAKAAANDFTSWKIRSDIIESRKNRPALVQSCSMQRIPAQARAKATDNDPLRLLARPTSDRQPRIGRHPISR